MSADDAETPENQGLSERLPGVVPVRVLLVDDDPLFHDLCEWFLRRKGSRDYSIYRASTIRQAWELCNTHRFDCVLVDYRLPDGDGTKFIQSAKLARCLRETGFVLMSAHQAPLLHAAARQAGASGFLSKMGLTASCLCSMIDLAIPVRLSFYQSSQNFSTVNRFAWNDKQSVSKGFFTTASEPEPTVKDGCMAKYLTGENSLSLPEHYGTTDEGAVEKRRETRLDQDSADHLELVNVVTHSISMVLNKACRKSVSINTSLPSSEQIVLKDACSMTMVFSDLLSLCVRQAAHGQGLLISARCNDVDRRVSIDIGHRLDDEPDSTTAHSMGRLQQSLVPENACKRLNQCHSKLEIYDGQTAVPHFRFALEYVKDAAATGFIDRQT